MPAACASLLRSVPRSPIRRRRRGRLLGARRGSRACALSSGRARLGEQCEQRGHDLPSLTTTSSRTAGKLLFLLLHVGETRVPVVGDRDPARSPVTTRPAPSSAPCRATCVTCAAWRRRIWGSLFPSLSETAARWPWRSLRRVGPVRPLIWSGYTPARPAQPAQRLAHDRRRRLPDRHKLSTQCA